MIKRGLAISFLFLLLIGIFVSLVTAQDFGDVGDNLEKRAEQLEETKEKIEEYTDKDYYQEKWDYLGKEWKSILLKNKFVSTMDSFFTRISIVFQVFFGVPYALSLVLLGIVFLWLIVFIDAGRIINSWGIVKGGFAYLASAAFAIVLAQIQFFRYIVVLLGRLVFRPEHAVTRILII